MSPKRAQNSSSSKPVVKEEPPRYIFWDEYHWMVQDLSIAIRAAVPGNGTIYLLGVPRGGLLLALLLSYSNDRFKLWPPGRALLCLDGQMPKAFVVDDILETGVTREKHKGLWPFAVLIDKSFCHEGVAKADISVQEIKRKRWVVFPYERQDCKAEQVSRKVRGYGKSYQG